MQNGNGNTVMYAGSRADLFSFSALNAGVDGVVGFMQGTDKINLSAASAATALQTTTFDSSGTILMDGGSETTVWNTHLAASNFG